VDHHLQLSGTNKSLLPPPFLFLMDVARWISDSFVTTEEQEKNYGTIHVSKPFRTREHTARMVLHQRRHVQMVNLSTHTLAHKVFSA
jgi:hypothetical protein